MRTYERTHDWISFQLDLRRADRTLWMLLGEAQSKCQHTMGVPLLPHVARELLRLFLAKGVLATTAIEGNTLTEEEVLERLDGKHNLPPSKAYLGQEIDNVVAACNEIGQQVLSGAALNLSVAEIKHFNRVILHDLPLEEDVLPGEIRTHNVWVGRYKGCPPEDCEYLLEKLCSWLNDTFEAPGEEKIAFEILRAICAHIYMAWIHPFGDGNGRTARLIEFKVLLSSGVPATAAHLLSNHYNRTRSEYYRQLDLASRSGGDVLPFIKYALQGFVDGLREQIGLIQEQQLKVHWENFVYSQFRDKDKATDNRQRRLILDLSDKADLVPLAQIRYVSPRIAEAYARKTDKTIRRDLNALQNMGLLVKEERGYRARTETILAFLPPTRK